MLFRFRVVDRLPEPPSPAAVRGTLVHSVLERLFDAPQAERTVELANRLLPEQWHRMVAEDPGLGGLVASAQQAEDWLAAGRRLLSTYFTLEDPTRLAPAQREYRVSTALADGPRLRGIVDRLDIAPNGAIRVVDYKTGSAPRPQYQSGALFQLSFYALVIWRELSVVPARAQLIYLGDGQVLHFAPEASGLEATERKIRAVWAAIERAAESGDWRPSPSRLCDWCSFRDLCPAWGGTPPQVQPEAVQRSIGVVPRVA